MTSDRGRLIPWRLLDAAENMAVDQVMADAVDRTGQPTLRFYGWSKPTLSLGYFQASASRASHQESQVLNLVRRASGGGAIVHDIEWTYCIAVPLDSGQSIASLDLYRIVHGAIVAQLARMGVQASRYGDQEQPKVGRPDSPFLCFQRRSKEDLLVSGYKILGSAQRRGRRSLLQHGSLLLSVSSFAPQLPGIRELTGKDIEIAGFCAELALLLGDQLGLKGWQERPIGESEQAKVDQVVSDRFANKKWSYRR